MRAARRWMVAAMLASLAVPVIAFVESMARVRDHARVIYVTVKLRDEPQVPEHIREMADYLSKHSAAFGPSVGAMVAGTISFVVLGATLWMMRGKA